MKITMGEKKAIRRDYINTSLQMGYRSLFAIKEKVRLEERIFCGQELPLFWTAKYGDIVKYKNELPEEKEARESGKMVMMVLWADPPRCCLVEQVGLPINPTIIVNISDIEEA